MTTKEKETNTSHANSSGNLEKVQVLQKQGYTMVKLIGEGSYAKVYEAEYEDPNTKAARIRLACKVVNASEASKNFLTKFFPREMEIMSKLNHPNIIRVHSILMRKETYFIFMEYAVNGDLLEFIKAHGAVKESRAKIWFTQLLQALKYLHDRGIAHRDLKCENILLSKNFNVKLSDFGFARYVTNKKEEHVLSNTFCGSIAYSPPEIIKGIKYEPLAVDLWSVGIILFIMLNKAMPFEDKDLKKLYADQIERRWKVRTKLKHVLSQDVQKLMAVLLEPNPKKRLPVEKMLQHKWFLPESPTRVSSTTHVGHSAAEASSTTPRHTIVDEHHHKHQGIIDIDTGKQHSTTMSHHDHHPAHHHHPHHHQEKEADHDHQQHDDRRNMLLRKQSKKEADVLSQRSSDDDQDKK